MLHCGIKLFDVTRRSILKYNSSNSKPRGLLEIWDFGRLMYKVGKSARQFANIVDTTASTLSTLSLGVPGETAKDFRWNTGCYDYRRTKSGDVVASFLEVIPGEKSP